jgi:hypothetical protein
MLIEAGYARSPREADLLMQRYEMTSARDLLPMLPPRRKRPHWTTQIQNIIMRIEGARRQGDMSRPKETPIIEIRYQFKELRKRNDR